MPGKSVENPRDALAGYSLARSRCQGVKRTISDCGFRISPIEPYITGGQLIMGAMAWSAKTHDLRRDPGCVLQSVVTGPDTGEAELKLYGSAVEAGPELRDTAAGAWRLTCDPDKAIVFCLAIVQAALVDCDIKRGVVTTHQWSSRSGYSQASRPHP